MAITPSNDDPHWERDDIFTHSLYIAVVSVVQKKQGVRAHLIFTGPLNKDYLKR